MTMVAAGAATLLVGSTAFPKRARPPACPGATYALEPPLLAGGGLPAGAFVRATSTAIGIVDGVPGCLPENPIVPNCQ